MKKQKNSGRILITIACVLSFIAASLNFITIFALSFNFFGIVDKVEVIVNQLGYTLIGSDMSLFCIELAIVCMIDLFAGLRYRRILQNRFNLVRVGHSLMMQTILQMFFGFFLAGLLGCIGINSLTKRRTTPISHEEQVEYINDFKKKAMGEAIARLKELKAQGAISEEEYYETLNKILEG